MFIYYGQAIRCDCGIVFIGPTRTENYCDHSTSCDINARNRKKVTGMRKLPAQQRRAGSFPIRF